MKRRILLALALVSSLASLADAVPIITGATTIEPGQTVNLTMEGTYAEASGGTAGNSNSPPGGFSSGVFIDIDPPYWPGPYLYHMPYIATVATIGNGSAATEAMGGMAALTIPYYYGIYFSANTSATWAETTDVDIGPWFSFDLTLDSSYSGLTDGSVVIPVDIGWTSDLGGLDVTIIPEPVTIALLGLGGLALLRKHRKYTKRRV